MQQNLYIQQMIPELQFMLPGIDHQLGEPLAELQQRISIFASGRESLEVLFQKLSQDPRGYHSDRSITRYRAGEGYRQEIRDPNKEYFAPPQVHGPTLWEIQARVGEENFLTLVDFFQIIDRQVHLEDVFLPGEVHGFLFFLPPHQFFCPAFIWSREEQKLHSFGDFHIAPHYQLFARTRQSPYQRLKENRH